jgi:hypothetical protein
MPHRICREITVSSTPVRQPSRQPSPSRASASISARSPAKRAAETPCRRLDDGAARRPDECGLTGFKADAAARGTVARDPRRETEPVSDVAAAKSE